ncbi:MAG: hypothetical protein MAG794_00906 [Gammaproteobacteria bacterium]|nr:hypothetical protein [Gammaproteobacteria bacterium]
MFLLKECADDGGELLQRAQEANDFTLQVSGSGNRRLADPMALEMIPDLPLWTVVRD